MCEIYIGLAKVRYGILRLGKDFLVGNVCVTPGISVYLCHDVFGKCLDNISCFQTTAIFWYVFSIMVAPTFLRIIDECSHDLSIINLVNMRRSSLLMDMHENGHFGIFSSVTGRVTRYGSHLIEFCKALGLLILNERAGKTKSLEILPAMIQQVSVLLIICSAKRNCSR